MNYQDQTYFDITDNFVFEIEINQITSSSDGSTPGNRYKYTLDSLLFTMKPLKLFLEAIKMLPTLYIK